LTRGFDVVNTNGPKKERDLLGGGKTGKPSSGGPGN